MVILITGGSSGIGKAIGTYLFQKGHKVYGTARNPKNYINTTTFPLIALDLTNEQTIISAIEQVISNEGHIDVLINNAGVGITGAVEELSSEQITSHFQTNYFGALAVIRAVLPSMRSRKSGLIINVTSIAGRIGSQGLGIYNGSKFALEGIGEALAAELKPLNIKVTNVEPGPFRTEWAGGSATYDNTKIADYESTVGERITSLQNLSGNQPGDPAKAADAIYKLAQLEEAPVHLPLGKIAYEVFGKVNNGLIEELAKFEHLGKECDFE